MAGFTADVVVPEPSDAAYPKWAVWAVAISVAGAIDAVVNMCSDDEKENTCDLHLDEAATEFSNKPPGKTYACVYKQRGSFGMFTFPQWTGLPCYPVDLKRCMVDTRTMDPALYGRK